MELMKAIGQRAIEKTVSDPRARTFLGRAGLIARALMGETSHVEFPVVDLVAKSMGIGPARAKRAVERSRRRGFPAGGEADRKAVGALSVGQ